MNGEVVAFGLLSEVLLCVVDDMVCSEGGDEAHVARAADGGDFVAYPKCPYRGPRDFDCACQITTDDFDSAAAEPDCQASDVGVAAHHVPICGIH